jgi:radical SAM protein with 4Fe4S-binding SPASM domain
MLDSIRVVAHLALRHLEMRRGQLAYDQRRHRTHLEGPVKIQIQTVDRCNGACIMCPSSSLPRTGPKNEMDQRLFDRILHQVKEAGTVKRLILMLQNEPLLDSLLAERLARARKFLHHSTRIIVVTNGSLLDSDVMKKLLRSGMDQISISIDAFRGQTYKRIRPGLDFPKVVSNVENLLRNRGSCRVKVKFLMQRANEGEEKAFTKYWRARGAAVGFMNMTNRAGALGQFERLKTPRTRMVENLLKYAVNQLDPFCPLPFTQAAILWDGRVILCTHDWEHRDIMGDISRTGLKEIWNCTKMNHYRDLLRKRRYRESLICSDCSLAKRFWYR